MSARIQTFRVGCRFPTLTSFIDLLNPTHLHTKPRRKKLSKRALVKTKKQTTHTELELYTRALRPIDCKPDPLFLYVAREFHAELYLHDASHRTELSTFSRTWFRRPQCQCHSGLTCTCTCSCTCTLSPCHCYSSESRYELTSRVYQH